MNNVTILMVDDNESILEINSEALRMEGYKVLTSGTIAEARNVLASSAPDIIVLDIMLPDGSGIAFCREIRENTAAPIIFLTCLNEKENVVEALWNGGDDYLTKPYHIEELIARIKCLLRRVQIDRENQPGIIQLGFLTLDTNAQCAYLNGEDLLLKPREFLLLVFLAKNEGKKFTAEQLYKSVWGMISNNDMRTVKSHISNLRKKLRLEETGMFSLETLERKYYVWSFWGQ